MKIYGNLSIGATSVPDVRNVNSRSSKQYRLWYYYVSWESAIQWIEGSMYCRYESKYVPNLGQYLNFIETLHAVPLYVGLGSYRRGWRTTCKNGLWLKENYT